MSLKYRMVILTTFVFAATFGMGTLLGVYGARRLAESQLRSRLAESAAKLARSGAPLNQEVLARFAPLLRAEAMVLDRRGRMVAHSGADWPWDKLRAAFLAARAGAARLNVGERRYYLAAAAGRLPGAGEPARLILLSGEEAIREPTRTILHRYLIVLCITAALLAAGVYLVGLDLVRRIRRLNRRIDSTVPGSPAAAPRRGDELARLSEAFDDLLGRLQHSRERLLAQQRLATTGKIASSIAHEVRNPLQAMRLTVEMLGKTCPAGAREGCELVLSEIDRLVLLTDELLVLAGKDTRQVERLDLSHELRETVRLLRHQLSRGQIDTQIDLGPLPGVRMDRNRCRQLLLNLLLNAVEASPAGGTVRVSGSAGKGAVVIRIADSGPGFPPQVLAGQAEEFFSTKATGAGLGLSICRRIVAEAGGDLALHNGEVGAVAEVTLPSAGDAGTAGGSDPPQADGGQSPPGEF